jgi:hypothetical protein
MTISRWQISQIFNCIEGIVYRLVRKMGICLYCLPVWLEVLESCFVVHINLGCKDPVHVRGRYEGRDSSIYHNDSHTPFSRLECCIMTKDQLRLICIMTKDQLLLIFGSPESRYMQTAIFAVAYNLFHKKACWNDKIKLV